MKRKIRHNAYTTQKDTKRRHRDFIVNSLEKEPKLFLELLRLGKNDVNGLKSPMGLSRVLDELQSEGIVSQEATKKDSRGIERKAYTLTKRGKEYGKGIWELMLDLYDLKDKGSSYIGGSSSTLFNENPKPLPNISSYNIAYPSALENNLNTVRIQFNTEKAVIKEVINELIKTNLEKIPKDAKSVFAFKVEWDNCINFARDIKIFMDDIKNDKDFLIDSELEFKGYEYPKLPLLESYLDSADLIEDEQYKEKFEALAKKDKFVSTLLSFGLWANWLDTETLNEVTKIFKSGNDPLFSKKLIKKLVIKAGNGFYVPLYDYIAIIRILNHNDIAFRNKLREYETENRYRPDKSKLFKIQNELRGKEK